MGQYYKPIILQKDRKNIKKWWDTLDFDCGAKLTEHSWQENRMVESVRKFLVEQGGGNLVWAGDYADKEERSNSNLYMLADYISWELKQPTEVFEELGGYYYYVNHDKKEYVDTRGQSEDRWGWRIDPLPLLTAEGNGRGGGDYQGTGMEYVGSWARDFITLEKDEPDTEVFKKLEVIFEE